MTSKSLFISCALALSMLGTAWGASWSITLTGPTKAGATVLKPGVNELQLKGTQLTLTNEAGKSFSIAAKVEQNDKKFATTLVDVATASGGDFIREIDLGGTTTKIEFAQ